MQVSKYESGISPDFTLTRDGNQVTATFFYGLTGYYDEELGYYLWDGELGAEIGAFANYVHQTADYPMDLELVATLTPGVTVAGSYFVNDNIGGASFDQKFNVTLFDTAANFTGTATVDLVFGSAFADTFRSVGGGDVFEGGAGDDLYRIYSADTQVVEVAGGGNDQIAAAVSYVLAAGVAVERLTTTSSTGTTAINLAGNALSQTIIGNAGDNELRSGSSNIHGQGDLLRGLGGNDTYRVSNEADQIIETAGGGIDRVISSRNYHLAAGVHVELLTTNGATGTADLRLSGNELSQKIVGNAGKNILSDGAGGLDILQGLGGDDTYNVNTSGTTIIEGKNGGNDTAWIWAKSYELNADAQVEILRAFDYGADIAGNRYSTTIRGHIGENILSAAAGQSGVTYSLFGERGDDVLVGGAGIDVFYGDDDDENDLNAAGKDMVSYAGAAAGVVANAADPSLNTGAAAGDQYHDIEGLTGTAHDDTLVARPLTTTSFTLNGGAGFDTLIGSAFNDILNLGADGGIAKGGAGSDYYILESATGNIIEEEAPSTFDGWDRVGVYVTFVLPDLSAGSFEGLLLMGSKAINGTGNELDNGISGNKAKNILTGLAGNDTLASNGGGDTLIGGEGDDVYYARSEDIIVEVAGDGFDTVITSTNSITLAAGVDIELVKTSNSTGTYATKINLIGNEIVQKLIGNATANVLDGKGGSDTLQGMAGKDTFVFSSALGPSNVDTIVDFKAVDDTIELTEAVFTSLSTGTLAASVFTANAGGVALDADDRIIYETDTGKLFYDADGNGAGAAVQFAVLTGSPTITNADFVVV